MPTRASFIIMYNITLYKGVHFFELLSQKFEKEFSICYLVKEGWRWLFFCEIFFTKIHIL